MVRAFTRRVLLLGVACLVAASCAAPVVAGRWQVTDNPNAGLEVRADGTFQGEIGPTGGPRVRLNGTWVATGADVTFTPAPTPQASAPVPLVGKIDGDAMTLTASVPGAGSLTLTLKRRTG